MVRDRPHGRPLIWILVEHGVQEVLEVRRKTTRKVNLADGEAVKGRYMKNDNVHTGAKRIMLKISSRLSVSSANGSEPQTKEYSITPGGRVMKGKTLNEERSKSTQAPHIEFLWIVWLFVDHLGWSVVWTEERVRTRTLQKVQSR
jgi:hypothetical protein